MKITGITEKGAEYYDDLFNRVPQNIVPRQRVVVNRIQALNLDKVSILDVGCGCGTFAEAIPKDWNYRGFDFSSVAIAKAKEKYSDRKFQVGSVYDPQIYLPVDYNVIVCGQVLEHTDDLKVLELFPKNVHIFVTVPTFSDPSHIRYFENVTDIYNRYSGSLDLQQAEHICTNQILFRGIKH